MDRHADTSDARSVGLRHIVSRCDRHSGRHLDLAANVQKERLVRNASDLHVLYSLDRVNYVNRVVMTRRVDREITHHVAF